MYIFDIYWIFTIYQALDYSSCHFTLTKILKIKYYFLWVYSSMELLWEERPKITFEGWEICAVSLRT